MRKLNYALAINEALHQSMASNDDVFLIGQGVNSPWYVGNTAKDLLRRFGSNRLIDTPVSENAMTRPAVCAALAGMRPVVVHPRMDFMLYAMDPIINQAANWYYMNGGRLSVPVVFWGIINRGGEQAAQHSQAFHTLFGHIPGLKVVMPATPHDAKGLMISAIKDDNPVVFIDDRWLHKLTDRVPEEPYEIPIGQGAIRREGTDVTIVAVSYMVQLAIETAKRLSKDGIETEIVDLRSIKPIDKQIILNSVKKTGKLVVTDIGWKTYGLTAEISAILAEEGFSFLKAPIQRVALPDVPAPASAPLEKVYYPACSDLFKAVMNVF